MSVYFIQAGDAGPIKIGSAAKVVARLNNLQVAHYEELHIRAVYPRGAGNEGWYHQRFQQHRIRGEWFLPAPEILECIEQAPAFEWTKKKDQRGRPRIEFSRGEIRIMEKHWYDRRHETNEDALEAMREEGVDVDYKTVSRTMERLQIEKGIKNPSGGSGRPPGVRPKE